MADILVLGAGLTGLTTAMLLARDGHDVTVLERDAAAPAARRRGRLDRLGPPRCRPVPPAAPDAAALAGGHGDELPDVLGALRAAGGPHHNMLHHRPAASPAAGGPATSGSTRSTARRPVLEAAVARAAASRPACGSAAGCAVAGLLTGEAGAVPRVVGVRTDGGDVRADLVVDAAGRRSAAGRWIVDVGRPRPGRRRADCGFVYYGPALPRRRTPAGVDPMLSHNDVGLGAHAARGQRDLGRGHHHQRPGPRAAGAAPRASGRRRCAATRPPRRGSTPSRSPGSR